MFTWIRCLIHHFVVDSQKTDEEELHLVETKMGV